MDTVYKASELKQVEDDQYEFIASDESVDRYGDIVRADGWELKNYKRNPIVLFQHQSSNPVGISTKAWIESKALLCRIKLAAEGTSPFIDSLRKLLAQRIIRAVSVGFRPTKPPNYVRDEQNDRVTGYEFIGQELLEISLVTVPANANALNMAKSFGVPDAHLTRIFVDPQEGKAKDASVFLFQQRAAIDIIKARRLGQ